MTEQKQNFYQKIRDFVFQLNRIADFFSLSVLSFSANRIPKSQTLKPEVTLINAAMKHGGDVETRKPVGV